MAENISCEYKLYITSNLRFNDNLITKYFFCVTCDPGPNDIKQDWVQVGAMDGDHNDRPLSEESIWDWVIGLNQWIEYYDYIYKYLLVRFIDKLWQESNFL